MIKQYLEEHKGEFERWIVGKEQGRIDIKILPYLQDIENGIFYETMKEVSELLNIRKCLLSEMLNNKKYNNTNLIYV